MKMTRKIALLMVAFAGTLFATSNAKAAENQVPKITGIEHLSGGMLPEQTNIIDYVLNKHKGKVVYIDFWAAWCAPCMRQFKEFAKPLHEAYKGKDVVFVNLCFESPRENWLKAIEDADIHGDNYLIPEGKGRMVLSAYELAGFPSYLLFNKEGKLVTPKAPRPSQLEELKKLVDPLL